MTVEKYMHIDRKKLTELAKLVRYFIIRSTTAAGSGHVTSSFSATELMTTLFFGFFHANLKHPQDKANDRLIFSKGHASPLLYSLYAAAGVVTEEELLDLRKFGSRLEGHPTLRFPYTEAPTGSLGQGLSIGVGMALSAKYLDNLPYKTFVLLGDSEMAEGSNYEAMQVAVHYKLSNLVAILDVNRLGQRGETMSGWRVAEHERRAWAFGWKTIVVDGHDIRAIAAAYGKALAETKKPVMIIAKTIKGKGISFTENKEGWHGRAMNQEEYGKALHELGEVNRSLRGMVPEQHITKKHIKMHGEAMEHHHHNKPAAIYTLGTKVATRKAYGEALIQIFPHHQNMVVLDAETSNSTGAEIFKKECEKHFFEMYIAEQNMVGVALGLSRRGKMPFVSTFAAFFSRAHDQIRMCQYANANIKFVGSHAGVSIGEDGASQMGLEDIALFRSLLDSVVLYPSDAPSTEKLVAAAAAHHGIVYLRTTRSETPVLYSASEEFVIGGSKTLRASSADQLTIVGAGITLHEALKAYDVLKKQGITVRVIDLYSIKPVDVSVLEKSVRETKGIIVVEDHYAEGGIAEAVRSALAGSATRIESLAVRQMPQSGTRDELLAFEEIDATAIVKRAKQMIS